eukprot:6201120-Pleurochrysis_carterae.AAC.2
MADVAYLPALRLLCDAAVDINIAAGATAPASPPSRLSSLVAASSGPHALCAPTTLCSLAHAGQLGPPSTYWTTRIRGTRATDEHFNYVPPICG